ncbi:glycosyltransferase [Aurantibacillus circumpalustris]|uniref:glycosyltransferase n=1 Tax=Aurantibacillus circumpalustris TaxID=3036359 RepID=UPI00295C2EC9|nr:glycosyltransferase [Aurantibacillus circumpalustris]
MNALIIVLFSLLFCYSGILLWLAYGFIKTPYFSSKEKKLQLPLTLIICARNEEKNIMICLSSLLKQKYVLNKIQLILINDASTDSTVHRAETILKNSGINYKIISNQQQKGKKHSISYAMQFAINDLIVLRDADTFTLSDLWLQNISDFYQSTKADLIIAPIAIANYSGLFWSLQAIENNVLTVAACGSAYYNKPFLCNGANLIFTKKIFEKTNGYSSHIDSISGDDIFFMEDVKQIQGSKIAYLKSAPALVYTYPTFSFKKLLLQKTRWASKFKLNKNKLNLILSFLTLTVNIAWLLCLVSINIPEYKNISLLFISLKLFIDILLLFLASGFIKNKNILWFSLPVGFIYPVYAGIIGIASLFVKPKWK